ncbi:MAG TPA: CPBP family intramembrane glutamic endopeptidase [Egibacteraceae bacterium]
MDPLSSYLLAVAVVGGTGAFAVSADLYARVFRRRGARVLDVYTAVLALAVVPGVVVLGPALVVGTAGGWRLGAGAAVGAVVGVVARAVDRRVVRAAARRRRDGGGRRASAGGGSEARRVTRVEPSGGALLLGGGPRRAGPAVSRAAAPLDRGQFPLGTVVLVALAEELCYRGVLLRAALLPGGWIAAALVIGTVIVFALAHVTFGWEHVLAKAPLGVLTTAVVLLSGTIVPAAVAHVVFNVSVWRDIRSTGSVSG